MRKGTNHQLRFFEISAVVLTGLAKFLCVDVFEVKFYFILSALIFWVAYIVYKYQKNPDALDTLGLSMRNFREVFLKVLPFGVISLIAFILYGLTQKTLIFNWHIIPVLLLYPVWGGIQQFITVGLIAGNLQDFEGKNIPHWLIILVTSIVFSLVHYPSNLLMLGTFILALFYTYIYLQKRNLYVLGIFHGWIGGLFYFFVLSRDPWVEVFSSM